MSDTYVRAMRRDEIQAHIDGVSEALALTIELLRTYNPEGEDLPMRVACSKLIAASSAVSQAAMAISE